jgi:hypothetical protein
MNKKELTLFRNDVAKVLAEREAVGDFDTNAQYMRLVLKGMLNLIDHAIDKYPKIVKK